MSEPKTGRWLEEYGCGCTYVARFKKELIGYCGMHGPDRRMVIKLLFKTEIGHDGRMER